ncbi:hypothetical protein ESCO_005880 [Escovopsis weberi]|uniref:Translation initiation factor IF-3 n=1 Tax=Escovopsis weberi TaxID=150374 RepID=A0A0M8N030_ESCWE|nr:hypothetical protein ESCO_005880 [Escovopsis weberi]
MRTTAYLRDKAALCALAAAPALPPVLRPILSRPPAPARLLHSYTPRASSFTPARRQHQSQQQQQRNSSDGDGGAGGADFPPRKLVVPRGYTTQRDIDRSGRDRPPWDHEITDPLIMVIDNGVPEGPLKPAYVLTKLDPEESLRMIQPYIPGEALDEGEVPGESTAEGAATTEGPGAGTPPGSGSGGRPPPRPAQYALCKIVNKRAEYERQRALRERRRVAAASKPKTKELEMTWAIGGGDLAVKMARLRGFLDRGMRVELTIGRKKGGRRVPEDEAAGVLRAVREGMEASGGREGKPATGSVGGTMKLYLEGVVRR